MTPSRITTLCLVLLTLGSISAASSKELDADTRLSVMAAGFDIGLAAWYGRTCKAGEYKRRRIEATMKGVMVWRHVPELYDPFEDSRDAGIKAGRQRMGKECRSKFVKSVPLMLDRVHETLDRVIKEFNVPAPPDDEWDRAVQEGMRVLPY